MTSLVNEDPTNSDVLLSWSKLESGRATGNSEIESYQLVFDKSETFGTNFIVIYESQDTTSFLQTGLDQGTRYRFKINAKNIYGYGEFSSDLTVITEGKPRVHSMACMEVNKKWTFKNSGYY